MLSEYLNRFLVPIDDPGSRLFHLNLFFAGAFILAWLLIQALRQKISGGIFVELKKLLFNPRYWWNASTKVDYQIYLLNGVFKVLVFIPFLEMSFQFSQWTLRGLLKWNGEFAGLDSTYPAVFAFTLFTFIWDDFLRFGHHYLMHRIPILWRFHQMHHSAHVLTPMTLYRTHPIESAMATIRNSISLGCATGLFIFFFESRFSVVTIAGVNAFGFLFNLLASNLRHSHVPISFGIFEAIFISPKQHQIHHSRDPRHFDRNFGVSLSVWDKIMRTWLSSSEAKEKLRFGLAHTPSGQLMKQLIRPFRT